jgi:hypothetical protein
MQVSNTPGMPRPSMTAGMTGCALGLRKRLPASSKATSPVHFHHVTDALQYFLFKEVHNPGYTLMQLGR